jgi:siroheme synthase
MAQEAINALLVELGCAGKTVVRLKAATLTSSDAAARRL